MNEHRKSQSPVSCELLSAAVVSGSMWPLHPWPRQLRRYLYIGAWRHVATGGGENRPEPA